MKQSFFASITKTRSVYAQPSSAAAFADSDSSPQTQRFLPFGPRVRAVAGLPEVVVHRTNNSFPARFTVVNCHLVQGSMGLQADIRLVHDLSTALGRECSRLVLACVSWPQRQHDCVGELVEKVAPVHAPCVCVMLKKAGHTTFTGTGLVVNVRRVSKKTKKCPRKKKYRLFFCQSINLIFRFISILYLCLCPFWRAPKNPSR